MQLIITDAWLARSRAIHLSGLRLAAFGLLLSLAVMLMAALLYHWVFLKGAREGWPVVGTLVRLATRDESAERDRFMRANLDAMARKVGEMQARMLQLESLGERVSGLAGMSPAEFSRPPGQGGALVSSRPMEMDELQRTLDSLAELTDRRVDLLTVVESRLFDQHIRKNMVPTQEPVLGKAAGSAFGWRIDPFTGQSALHTGLDFQADTGTPILAAAAAWSWRRNSTRPTATWWRSTTATNWSPAMPMPPAPSSSAATSCGGARRSPRSAPPAGPPVRTCISRCWCRACRRTRRNSCMPVRPAPQPARRWRRRPPRLAGKIPCSGIAAPGCRTCKQW